MLADVESSQDPRIKIFFNVYENVNNFISIFTGEKKKRGNRNKKNI